MYPRSIGERLIAVILIITTRSMIAALNPKMIATSLVLLLVLPTPAAQARVIGAWVE